MTQNASLSGHDVGAPPGRTRIAALDVLRGFALCGILLVNAPIIADTGGPGAVHAIPGMDDPLTWLSLGTSQRFLPIFALLFGVGFALLAESAAQRSPKPRLVLLRRLLALFAIGLAHLLFLWPGDILTSYAVIGLVVLLPSTWLPRWAVAGLAAVFLAVGIIFGGIGPVPVAGLFLLGSALVRYGAVGRMGVSVRGPALLGLAFAAGAVPALWWQIDTIARESPDFGPPMAVAGLLLAGVYVCALLVLLGTPLRSLLRAVFEPLGRMALTNYLTATVLVLATSQVLGLRFGTLPQVLSAVGAVLAAQWAFSALWLRRYRQGPVEWLWRWSTWWSRPPLRAAPRAPGTPLRRG